MIAEIQKLEAAARLAMGHFEDPGATSMRPRARVPHPAYMLLALTVVGGLALFLSNPNRRPTLDSGVGVYRAHRPIWRGTIMTASAFLSLEGPFSRCER